MNAKICIVDDHLVFGEGLKQLFHGYSPYRVTKVFSNPFQLIEHIEMDEEVDLVTMDIMMPEMDGIQLLSYLKRNRPNIKSVILSGHYNKSTFELCKNMGADGFLPKELGAKEILKAMESIIGNRKYFYPEIENKKKENSQSDLYGDLREKHALSPREVEVIQLLLNQFATHEIADRLNLSPHTIKTHRKNIFSKMKVKNITGLVGYINNASGD